MPPKVLMTSSGENLSRFDELLEELESLIDRRKMMEEERKLSVLREKTVIAMTITGAAINSGIIQKLGPRLVGSYRSSALS